MPQAKNLGKRRSMHQEGKRIWPLWTPSTASVLHMEGTQTQIYLLNISQLIPKWGVCAITSEARGVSQREHLGRSAVTSAHELPAAVACTKLAVSPFPCVWGRCSRDPTPHWGTLDNSRGGSVIFFDGLASDKSPCSGDWLPARSHESNRNQALWVKRWDSE